MWIKKDVLGLWSNVSSEDLLPLLVTNGAVMLLKIAVLAGGIYLVKMLFVKIKKK